MNNSGLPPVQTRLPMSRWADLVLARLPSNGLTVAWLMTIACSCAIIGTRSPIAGMVLATATGLRLAVFRRRAAGSLALLRIAIPPMKKTWQPRYFLIRRLARHFAARAGVEVPEIILDGGNLIGSLNAGAMTINGHNLVLLDPQLLDPGVGKMLNETCLAGVVAHEIAHLRTGRLEGGTVITSLRRSYVDALVPSVMVCILFLGAPIDLVFPMWGALAAVTYLALAARRREEIEADRVGASLFARNGGSAILGGLLLMSVADSTNVATQYPSARLVARFRAAVERAARFGALSVRPGFGAACTQMVGIPERRGIRELVIRWQSAVAHPWRDHPDVEAVASLLGLRQISSDIALRRSGDPLPADHVVVSLTVSRNDAPTPLV